MKDILTVEAELFEVYGGFGGYSGSRFTTRYPSYSGGGNDGGSRSRYAQDRTPRGTRYGRRHHGYLYPRRWAYMPGWARPFHYAARWNRVYARRLGWSAYYPWILPVLGLSGDVADDIAFAQAVAAWQNRNGLPATGYIGPRTWAALQAARRGDNAALPEPDDTDDVQQSEVERHLGVVRTTVGGRRSSGVRVRVQATVSWLGAFSLPNAKNQRGGGIYVMERRGVDRRWTPIYIGETGSFHSRWRDWSQAAVALLGRQVVEDGYRVWLGTVDPADESTRLDVERVLVRYLSAPKPNGQGMSLHNTYLTNVFIRGEPPGGVVVTHTKGPWYFTTPTRVAPNQTLELYELNFAN